jgi:hypothetical protein
MLAVNRLLKISPMPSASKPFSGTLGLPEARSGLKNRFLTGSIRPGGAKFRLLVELRRTGA